MPLLGILHRKGQGMTTATATDHARQINEIRKQARIVRVPDRVVKRRDFGKAKPIKLEECPFCGSGCGHDERFLLCDVSDMAWPDHRGRAQTVRKRLGVSRAYAVHSETCGAWGPVQTSQNRAMRDWEKS